MGANRPAPWAGKSGYEKMSSLLKSKGKMEIATTLEDWCKAKMVAISKARFRCIKCRVEKSATINNIQRGQHICCKCNGRSVRWSTEEGFVTFSKYILDNGIELVSLHSLELWKSASIGKKSSVELRCTNCGISAWSTVDHIVDGHHIRCHCTGGPFWNGKGGYDRAVEMVEGHPRFRFVGSIPSFQNWANEHPVSIECKECSYKIDMFPGVMAKLSADGLACLCTNRGEKDMYIILKSIVTSNLKILVHAPYTHVGGLGGGMLRCDFAISRGDDVLLYIEVDGGYHFGLADSHPRSRHSGMTMRHDILKETRCPIPIVRLCVDTVRTHPLAAGKWVKTLIEVAESGALKGVHRWSVRNLYSKSKYACMRERV